MCADEVTEKRAQRRLFFSAHVACRRRLAKRWQETSRHVSRAVAPAAHGKGTGKGRGLGAAAAMRKYKRDVTREG